VTGLWPDEAFQELVSPLEGETGLDSLEVLDPLADSLQDLIEEQSEDAEAVAQLAAALAQVIAEIDRRIAEGRAVSAPLVEVLGLGSGGCTSDRFRSAED
jgi:hypothetical protein